MSEILSTVRVSPLLSPRTANYVEAMIRDGDSFDYNEWLKKVRKEESQAKQAGTLGTSGELIAAQIADPIKTSNDQLRPKPVPPLIPKLFVRALRRQYQEAQGKTPKARLRRWLEKIHGAWGEFQGSRKREGVYIFLDRVFEIVMHYKVRRRTKRLLRHAFQFANLPFNRNMDPFAVIIRCACGNAADNKTISKWARALRYVARCKKPDTDLKKFMKRAGGVNGCAARYAQRNGRTC
jgi:hypothetical protein